MINETLKNIRNRRSIRDFRQIPIKEEELAAIVDAGLYAPNGGGEAWHFTVIQNTEILERLNRLAKQYAAGCGLPWLEELGKDRDFHSMHHAPTVILVSGDERNVCAVYDVSAATENMLIAAESLDIGSCWGYFVTQAFLTDEGKALREELRIPDGYMIYTSVMLGYKNGRPAAAPERGQGLVTYIK